MAPILTVGAPPDHPPSVVCSIEMAHRSAHETSRRHAEERVLDVVERQSHGTERH
ncbi:hypothetical protein [Nonomuraea guangzhouensis]|uniref:Uncharacterized protein n=1 Tax=Nonomuraea guangzhouensis TaxID=1291555 RepID=A0ABW4GGC0_9ACTN|nr:hypothetical protein [Nonomuraea guangzhouensis]